MFRDVSLCLEFLGNAQKCSILNEFDVFHKSGSPGSLEKVDSLLSLFFFLSFSFSFSFFSFFASCQNTLRLGPRPPLRLKSPIQMPATRKNPILQANFKTPKKNSNGQMDSRKVKNYIIYYKHLSK